MQVFNGKIEGGKESISSATLFLSNQISGESEMTEKILSSSPKSIKICTIEGCHKPHDAKGLCYMHYAQIQRKHPLCIDNNITGERFWNKVALTADKNRCWIWQGGLHRRGYGRIKIIAHYHLAHRIAWFLFHNKHPEGNLLHSCDNPPCVNPNHLREGTLQENVADQMKRGRHVCGEKSPFAKLTESEVVEIRRLIPCGMLQKNIAKQFNMSESKISDIKNRRSWSHV
jgi:hypothetical protein